MYTFTEEILYVKLHFSCKILKNLVVFFQCKFFLSVLGSAEKTLKKKHYVDI